MQGTKTRLAAGLLPFFAAGAFAGATLAQSPPAAPRILWRIDKPSFYHELPVHRGEVWTGGRNLTVHDLKTGEELHRAELEGPWWHPVSSGGLVFARHSGGRLHAFVPDLSREVWQLPLKFSRYPGTTHGDMYFASAGNEVVAIAGGEVHWRVDLGAQVVMRPATDGERVYAGTTAGDVAGIELHSGEITWRHGTGAEFGWTSPVVSDGILVLADRGIRDGRKAACNAFDAKTGKLLWSTQFGATGFSRPHVHGDKVWAGFGVTVASFDRETGALDRGNAIRTGRNPFGLPGVAGDAIVFGNLDGNLYVHDLETRELRWRFDANALGETQVAGWTLTGGILLVGTTKHGLFAIGETYGAKPVEPGFVLRPVKR